MKLNIAYPATGCQKVIEIDDERKLRAFMDKRIAHEINGESLGDDFAGYVFKITGGSDKQGFPMRQGVLTPNRVKLLFHENSGAFRPLRHGERRKKSVRGCVVSSELSVINLIVMKKGTKEIEGLTDTFKPRRLGPKRANKIRKMFNLEKQDDVRKYVVKSGKHNRGPRIQRLITPERLQRKRRYKAQKRQRWEKSRAEAKEYSTMISKRLKEQKDKRIELIKKKRETRRTTIAEPEKTNP